MQNHKLAAETNLFCASCARFQVMNRNGYVPCRCHVRFSQTCPLLHFCWPLTSVTLIYLTFSMLASVILAPSSFLVFSFNLSTFSRALGLFWLRWPHRMAVIMCEVSDITNCVTEQNSTFIRKENFWAQIARKVNKLKALKETSVFTDGYTWTKLRKQNSKPFTERNLIRAYLYATHWILRIFYAIPVFKKSLR